MTAFLYSLLGFLVAIAILVAVHEYGHFQVARACGVKVLKFSIGFGKPLFTWRRKGDPTEYCIGCIPLGGYVKMLDEGEGEVAADELGMAFNRQSLLKRTAVVAAGPAYNFLFAIFAVWLVFVTGSDDIEPVIGQVETNSAGAQAGFRAGDRLTRIDGREVRAWGEHQFYLIHQAMKGNTVDFEVAGGDGDGARSIAIDFAAFDQYSVGTLPVPLQLGLHPTPPPAEVFRVVADSPAARAGLQTGDTVTAIDGEPIGDWADMVRYVSARPGQLLALTVRRGDGVLSVELTPEPAQIQTADGAREVGRIGLYRPPPATAKLRYGPLAAVPAALDYNWRMTAVTLRSLGRMLSARMSSDNLSGPITIARLAGHTIESGVDDFLKFLAIISISLGLINLLPIPLLDGGHLLYFAIEAVKGSPPSKRAMLWGQQLGIALLVLLMGVAFYNDIARLF